MSKYILALIIQLAIGGSCLTYGLQFNHHLFAILGTVVIIGASGWIYKQNIFEKEELNKI